MCLVKDTSKPSMTKVQVIRKLDEDILIHENWIGYVTENPELADSYGNVEWHEAWIKVYQNAIYYVRRCR